jgi:hypothetical protein
VHGASNPRDAGSIPATTASTTPIALVGWTIVLLVTTRDAPTACLAVDTRRSVGALGSFERRSTRGCATIDWHRRLVPGVDLTEVSGAFPDAFLALAPLETPPTRQIVARTAGDEWTANLVNNHLGGDSVSWCGHLSGVLGCDAIEATHVPIDQYPYPTTAFTMTAPRASPPLHTLRHVHAGRYDSGRWEFSQDGEVQPFEQTERYATKRVRDRFDREMLLAYLGALGITADDPAFWIGGSLLQNRVTFQPRTSTLEEVQRSYGIVR